MSGPYIPVSPVEDYVRGTIANVKFDTTDEADTVMAQYIGDVDVECTSIDGSFRIIQDSMIIDQCILWFDVKRGESHEMTGAGEDAVVALLTEMLAENESFAASARQAIAEAE